MPLTYRIVRSEHFEINLVMKCLYQLSDGLYRKTWEPDFDVLYLILHYIEGFLETFHHPREEDYLFKAVRLRSPESGLLLDQLCHDHAEGVRLMTDLRQSLETYVGHPAARCWFHDAAKSYVHHQRQHMQKEEQTILPLALQVLSQDDWGEMDAAFQRNDHPLLGPGRQRKFDRLFSMILRQAPGAIVFGSNEVKVA